MKIRDPDEIKSRAERIIAQAKILAGVMEARKHAAQAVLDQESLTADRVIAEAEKARSNADAAQNAIATKPTSIKNVADAQEKYEMAAKYIKTASNIAGRASESETSDIKDEWKECRVTIDRLDKILVDLRKTGLSVVTAIIGGAAFLLSHPRQAAQITQQNATAQQAQNTLPSLSPTLADLPEVKVAISIVIAVLIFGLFTIDRVHARWLDAAVKRAEELEKNALYYNITQVLSNAVQRSTAGFVSYLIYIIFIGASWLVFMYGLETSQNLNFSFNYYQILVSGVIILSVAAMIVFDVVINRRK